MPAAHSKFPKRLRVVQELAVTHVEHDGRSLRVDVSPPGRPTESIVFSFDDELAALTYAEQVRVWMASARRLTYVKGATHAALIDDAEAFRRAFDQD